LQLAGLALLSLLALFSFPGAAQTQLPGADTLSAQSVSGQFTILSRRTATPSFLSPSLVANPGHIRLDPMLLPSSCERIKQAVWQTLGFSAPWRGQIFVALHPAQSPDETVTVIAQRFGNGWQYRVELPDTVQRIRYARALVEVVLQEIANRNAVDHSAEVPTWLTEGMTRQVLATSEAEIMLQSPRSVVNGINYANTLHEGRRKNPLTDAHREFLNHTPLTFEELSWPTANQLNDAAGEFYVDSAQLFLNRLLLLRNGRACLLAMVLELPQRYNWQFAFLHAFGTYFQRPLDVEKWWALQVVHFTGRDLNHAWNEEESWLKLDQAIRSAVQIRANTNQLPLTSEVTLQTIVGNWDYKAQTSALQSKLKELEWLRPRLAHEHAVLADDYLNILKAYLERRDHTGPFGLRKTAAQRQSIQDALRELGMLDTRRLAFKPKSLTTPKKLPTIQAQAAPAAPPSR
jgi:hypothetical protein